MMPDIKCFIQARAIVIQYQFPKYAVQALVFFIMSDFILFYFIFESELYGPTTASLRGNCNRSQNGNLIIYQVGYFWST